MKGLFLLVFLWILSIAMVGTYILLSYIDIRKYQCWLVLGAGILGELIFLGYAFSFSTLSMAFIRQGQWLGTLGIAIVLGLALAFPLLALWYGFSYWNKHRHRTGEGVKGELIQSKECSRKAFLGGVALGIPVLTSAASLGIMQGESHFLALTYHRICTSKVPLYLQGYRIGQISDPHMGYFFSPRQLDEAIQLLFVKGIQRLAITGDLIDELSLLPACEVVLKKWTKKIPHGIDFCYGNHEYYRDVRKITAMLRRAGVRIVKNEAYCAIEDRETPFYVSGVDFSFAKGKNFQLERERFIKKAMQHVPDNAFVLLLAHHSAFIKEAFAWHVPLTLCGHTHGGQINFLYPWVQGHIFTYVRGMYRDGDCYGYVNRGTGDWLPVRIGCSREVSVFELQGIR